MKILVLNDTRSENHHGCSRVMNAIDRNLFIRGVEDICYFKLMLRWDLDEDILNSSMPKLSRLMTMEP